MESPLIYDELEDIQLKAQFKELHILAQTSQTWREEAVAFMERIRQEITTKPILARIVRNKTTLFDVVFIACSTFDSEVSNPIIKPLIDANPSALLWGQRIPIYVIPRHPSQCSLLPWIAANHQWVLDHECFIDDPPVIHLLRLSATTPNETTSSFIAKIIREFFKAYPHSLSQEDSLGFSTLHMIVFDPRWEIDLVKWMHEQCPTNMMKQDRHGNTPLHVATSTLAKVQDVDTDTKEICKYMIQECSESVRTTNAQGMCPVHNLLNHCQHQAVREVVVCLLREYPESYDMISSGQAPMSFGFIKHVNSLLAEERALQDHVSQMQLLPVAFVESVKCTRDELIKTTSDVFNNWVVSSIQAIESKIELNSSLLQHACDYFIDYPNESDYYNM